MDYDFVGRVANAVLGTWLFLSSFLFRNSIEQQLNTGLVGACAVAAALAALYSWSPLRYVNAALGAWLVASPWLIPTVSTATVANNVLVGALMFGFAFMATGERPVRERRV